MGRWRRVSAFSVIAGAFFACGDDEKSPATGNAGSGGNAGTGGAAGMSGDAGAGATAGTAGTAGAAGTAGTAGAAGSGNPTEEDAGSSEDAAVVDAGPPPPCTSCLELRVPFTAASQTAFFQLVFPARNLIDTVARFRLRALLLDETGGLYVQTYATDSDGDPFGAGTFAPITAANFTDTETFANIDLDIGAISADGFNATAVVAIGVQVGSNGAFVGPATAVLLLDSVAYTGTGGLTNLDFSADAQGFARGDIGLQTAELIHH